MQGLPFALPMFGGKTAYTTCPQGEAAIEGHETHDPAQEHDMPGIAYCASWTGYEIALAQEVFKPTPQWEAVILDDQDVVSREPCVQLAIAIGAHCVDLAGMQRLLDLIFHKMAISFRKVIDASKPLVGDDHSLQHPAMTPGFLYCALDIWEVPVRVLSFPEEIA